MRRERLGRLSAAAKNAEQAFEDARQAFNNEVCEADAEGWTLGQLHTATERPRSSLQTIIVRRS
jgi:hypothetical protein